MTYIITAFFVIIAITFGQLRSRQRRHEKIVSELTDRYESITKAHKEKLQEKDERIHQYISEKANERWRHKEEIRMLTKQLNDVRLELEESKQKINEEYEQLLDALKHNHLIQKSATLKADMECMVYDDVVNYLKGKVRPAYTAAEAIAAMKEDSQKHLADYKAMRYKYELLLAQFPELQDYIDSIEEVNSFLNEMTREELNKQYDKTKTWLSEEEYNSMSATQRNQLALERWIARNKTSREIGFDYEMYIGHLYRENGWNVQQYGIKKGLEDLGRDIIAYKEGLNKRTVHIIQCKRWGQDKVIHENVICQLYGTAIQYRIKHPNDDVKAVFVSTTTLSETAKEFADALGVIVRVKPMGDYPRIKCNINQSTGERIYHLPFDQQYYAVEISKRGEFYAYTVNEAESQGFRRAMPHRSES